MIPNTIEKTPEGGLPAENCSLLLGDCLERMAEIPDGSVDLVLTDPPYRMTKRGKSCRPNWMRDNMGDNVFDGEVPSPSAWLEHCYRVMRDGHLYIFTNTVSLQETLNAATWAGFRLHNIISMIKDTGMPNRWYYKQTEIILFLRKGRAIPINDYTSRDNVAVQMPTQRTGKLHITQKPLDFTTKMVTNSSQQGGLVLDPFMGSGTTGVACMNTARKFIGIERDPEYFRVASERISLNNIEDGRTRAGDDQS